MGLGKIGILEMSKDSNNLYLNMLSNHCNFNTTNFSFYPTYFDEINNLLPHPSKELKKLLVNYLDKIKDVNYLIVPNITIHQTLDELFKEQTFKFKLIHPIIELVHDLKKVDQNKVVIFGSKHTMQPGYISSLLENYGIKCSFPTTKDYQQIETYRIAVYNKTATPDTINNFNTIVKKHATKTNVILACTELSLAYNSNFSNVFDLVKIQVASCFSK
ncbi:aspartate racemase [Wenyingzhuangia heitensis]|uniref:Aspartate racemase n=1 Tax=Wenyingzhuangia heitensis TaxID=1487859 RepID=A0ABX0UCN9_9FLAO|nr:aspartate/glutamate racemase family protein [Wenyingzhuangia heitensis]NIJ45635.1 aspartate racemase [Wenyingzhuangia heitensis]